MTPNQSFFVKLAVISCSMFPSMSLICEIKPSNDEMKILIEDLGHSSFQVREKAFRRLSKIKNLASDELIKSANDTNIYRCSCSFNILSQIIEEKSPFIIRRKIFKQFEFLTCSKIPLVSQKSFETLKKFAMSPDPEISKEALLCLGRLTKSENRDVASKSDQILISSFGWLVSLAHKFKVQKQKNIIETFFELLPKQKSIKFSKQIKDQSLIHFRNLKNLEELSLYPHGKKVTDQGIKQLQQLTRLKKLNLWNTKISDRGLTYLKKMSQLQELNLIFTQVTDQGLAQLKNLKNLQKINLNGTKVTDRGIKHLTGLAKLRYLDLYRTKISNQGLKELNQLTAIKKLNLWGTEITNAGLIHLKKLPDLELLWLVDTKITDQGLAHLTEFKNLYELLLYDTQITDAGIVSLKKMTQLEKLGIGDTQISEMGVQDLSIALPECVIDL